MAQIPGYLTVGETAERIDRSEAEVKRLAKQKILPGIKLGESVNSPWLFKEQDVAAFVPRPRGGAGHTRKQPPADNE
ncbi:MAG: helix-turn-helix domain-containing protein [Pyrinomonadaceae bacterium]